VYTHRIERSRVRRGDSRSGQREWISRRIVLHIPRNLSHAAQIRRRTIRAERHRMERHRISGLVKENARQLERWTVSKWQFLPKSNGCAAQTLHDVVADTTFTIGKENDDRESIPIGSCR